MKLGIDFGTTKTMVSRYNRETGQVEILPLGRGADDIPTTIHVDGQGKWSFGDDADDLMELDPAGYARAFKLTLGETEPVLRRQTNSGEVAFTAEELAARFIAHIKANCEHVFSHGETIEEAVIAIPVAFSPARKAALNRAALSAGFRKVDFVFEPEAAAKAYLRNHPDDSFKKALVVDWGGGTIDLAIVTRNAKGAVAALKTNLKGRDDIGGEEIDFLFLQSLCERWKKQFGALPFDMDDPLAVLKVRRIAKADKERLSDRDVVSTRLALGGNALVRIFSRSVKTDRTTFDSMIAPLVKQATELATSMSDSSIDMILLVGGTSMIPRLQKAFAECFTNCRVMTWGGARNAVSLGVIQPEVWHCGDSHPRFPNVLSAKERGHWLPAPGYEFPNRNNDDLTVVWAPGSSIDPICSNVIAADTPDSFIPKEGYVWRNGGGQKERKLGRISPVTWSQGTEHRKTKNVIADEEVGVWEPKPGYVWINNGSDEKRWKYGVRWEPGYPHSKIDHVVALNTIDHFTPEPGYAWESGDTGSRSQEEVEDVEWTPELEHSEYPHVFSTDEEGAWRPEPGYAWVRPGHLGKVRWQSNLAHPDYPHIHSVMIEGKWETDFGWTWCTDKPGDFSVKKSWYNIF